MVIYHDMDNDDKDEVTNRLIKLNKNNDTYINMIK